MSTGDVDVDVQLAAGEMAPVGRLFLHRRASSASFQYTPAWLAHPQAYAIDPQLPLGAGSFHTAPEQGLFRALADTAPDRWGVELARRYERKQAGAEGRTMRNLDEAHFLLAVRDGLRQGALRLRDPDSGAYLSADAHGVPHLLDLPRLLSASEHLEQDAESNEELRLLLEAGSSLGGARPKAVIVDQGRLYIAKFPRLQTDAWSVIGWERVAQELAAASGLSVPPSRMETVAGRQVLLLERFDRRAGGGRIGYVSAMTLLEARDGDRRTYLEIAEAIEQYSTRVTDDLRELWRRAAFSILISNTDDHLRNHGFLRVGAGWTLSPAFDLNPNPDHVGLLSTAIERARDRTASIEMLAGVAAYFRVPDPAKTLQPIVTATGRWRAAATALGLGQEISQLEPAFEHEQRVIARRLAGG